MSWPPFALDAFPLLGLRVTTPRLELRYGTTEELLALAALAGDFAVEGEPQWLNGWVQLPPLERMRSVLQYQWRRRGDWTPSKWALELQVFEDGVVVGTQAISAEDFAITKVVTSGSWLGAAHRGRGIGTEMRAAVLHLAFAGLGAERAESAAYSDNVRSLGVSRRNGYVENGIELAPRAPGEAAWHTRLKLERAVWERHRRDDITIEGLEPCLWLFGGQESAGG